MKQTPHGLKIDRRKSLMKNIEANGIERKITKGSGMIKMRERKLKRAQENNDFKSIERLEKELKELYSQIEE